VTKKRFFFWQKREAKKTPVFCGLRRLPGIARNEQKFFASFFQKRCAWFLLHPAPPADALDSPQPRC
jgi:hypothetical protein